MKATPIILAAVLTLSLNVLFAGNDGAAANPELNTVQTSLAPSTPSEATFEEVNDAGFAVITLAPVTPAEADFSDVAANVTPDIFALAPVTPVEADFGSGENQHCGTIALSPVTPSVADFSDGN
ncbi:MAG: hypothetical protein WCO44_05680 [Bacteroidota bacterium]